MTIMLRLWRSQTAATAIEYGLIAAIISVGCLAAYQALADGSMAQWNAVESAADQSTN